MGTLALSPFFTLAYSPETTHRALTQEIVKAFNSYYPNLKMGEVDGSAVEIGSVGEDNGARALHHFYDPVYNRGLFGQLSAKDWAQNTLAQASVFRPLAGAITGVFGAPTDYSWDRAVYDYVWVDKSRGLDGLGHILHLIEDMSVPDHTRNDAHPPYADKLFHQASPYEHWASKWNAETMAGLSTMIYHSGSQPARFSSLGEYFDSMATYSNNNFFSKDTTPEKSKEYFNPIIKSISVEHIDGVQYYFAYGELDSKKLRLVKLETLKGDNSKFITKFDDNTYVMNDYWSHLSKQAVLHGVGVVRLFFEAVEEERENKRLLAKNKTIFDRVASLLPSQVSGAVGLNNKEEPKPLVEEIPQSAFEPHLAVSPPSEPPDFLKLPDGKKPGFLEVSKPGFEESGSVLSPGGVTNLVVQQPSEAANLETKSPNEDLPPFLQLQAAGGGGSPGFGGGTPTPPAETPASDTTAPDISLDVSECPGLASVAGECLVASSTATVSWSSAAGDLNHYDVRCEVGGVSCDGFNFASTTATSTIYSLPADDSTYIFKAKAVDNAGNESAQTTKTVVFFTRPVVINEIAWAGTSANSADEWIELYNRSSKSVSIANWVLYAGDGVPYINLSGTISAGGYYLIERTDNDTVSDVTADLTAPFSGSGAGSGLGNGGETLVLSRASTTIDQTVLCSNAWCGGLASPTYSSMERIDMEAVGTDTGNWGTSNGVVKNGLDSAGAALTATPRARNSLHYLISQGATLSSDKTLKQSFGTYIIKDNETLTIASGKTLTIEPGVTVKMGDSADLIVDGTLKSDGTAANNILFTALSGSPAAGSWRNVRITSSSQNSSVSHTRFKYGGGFASNIPQERRALLSVIDNSITISNSIFENSFSAGARLTTSNSTIQNNTFSVGTTTADNVGFYVVGGAPTVSGNTFSENYFGAKAEGAAASYANNIFNNNISYALYSSNGSSTFSGNSGAGNGKNGIALLGTISAAGGTTTLASNSLAYLTISSSNAEISAGAGLVLEAGARFAGEDSSSRLTVNGALKLEGASKSSIVFTSLADTAPGEWYGIVVNSGGYMYGGGFTLRYGGYGAGGNPNAIAGIGVFGGSVSLSDGRIENNYKAGMRLYDHATSTLTNFEFNNHASPASNSTALVAANAGVVLNTVSFSDNFLGVSSSNSTIQATGATFSGNTTDKSPADAF